VGPYASTEGARVIASFGTLTYPGEATAIRATITETLKFGMVAAGGKLIPKGLSALEEQIVKIKQPSGTMPANSMRPLVIGDEPLSLNGLSDGGMIHPVAQSAPVITNPSPIVLDLFGGRTSQIKGAINVDMVAQEGVRASATQLPFSPAVADKIVASSPYLPGGSGMMDWLSGAAFTLKSGGTLIINATSQNKFAQLPSAEVLETLGLKIVQSPGPILPEFKNNIFRYTDGGVIPSSKVLTTILRKIEK
jgi:hypothetical protein